jgi:uncharacterized protein YkwD
VYLGRRQNLIWSLMALLGLAGCDAGGMGLLGSDNLAAGVQDEARTDAKHSECTTAADADEIARELVRLINIERMNAGSLELSPELTESAGVYACQMIETEFFGHENPKTGTGLAERATEADTEFGVFGENLAAGFWNAPDIVDAWLASESHRKVMLDPAFTHIGIGVRYGGEYGIYCVLTLAGPAPEDE